MNFPENEAYILFMSYLLDNALVDLEEAIDLDIMDFKEFCRYLEYN